MHTTVVLINNSASRAKRLLKEPSKLFKEHGLQVVKTIVMKQGDLFDDCFAQALTHNPTQIIIAGGDGTLIAAIDYFQKNGFKGDYGILPVGTSNYLARNLKIPLKMAGAIQVINRGGVKKIHLASANEHIFSLMAIVGVAADLIDNVSVELKEKYGQGSYMIALFKQLARNDAFEYSLFIDDEPTPITGRTHQLVFFNADINLQLKIAPSSSLEIPKLTITIFDAPKNILKFVAIVIIHALSFGRIKYGLKTYTVSKAKLSTSPSRMIAIDGESIGKTPVRIQAIRKKIRIIA